MNMKETQRKNDYLQKTLDAQVAYANELETQMADKDESIKGYALHLEQVCEDLYNLKANKKDLEHELGGLQAANEAAKGIVRMLEEENKRLREEKEAAILLAQDNKGSICPICELARGPLSKDSDE